MTDKGTHKIRRISTSERPHMKIITDRQTFFYFLKCM